VDFHSESAEPVHARSSDTSHTWTRQSDPAIWESVIQLSKPSRGCRTKGCITLRCDVSTEKVSDPESLPSYVGFNTPR
jgi:hypothetical protein